MTNVGRQFWEEQLDSLKDYLESESRVEVRTARYSKEGEISNEPFASFRGEYLCQCPQNPSPVQLIDDSNGTIRRPIGKLE